MPHGALITCLSGAVARWSGSRSPPAPPHHLEASSGTDGTLAVFHRGHDVDHWSRVAIGGSNLARHGPPVGQGGICDSTCHV